MRDNDKAIQEKLNRCLHVRWQGSSLLDVEAIALVCSWITCLKACSQCCKLRISLALRRSGTQAPNNRKPMIVATLRGWEVRDELPRGPQRNPEPRIQDLVDASECRGRDPDDYAGVPRKLNRFSDNLGIPVELTPPKEFIENDHGGILFSAATKPRPIWTMGELKDFEEIPA